ncbi:MAG: hypothetical protein WCP91_03805 [Candidatus Berkelbacteria bacterium]
MKFLAWFFAVIVFFSSFFVAFSYNLHQTFLTPEKTKQALVKVDFYNQIKSVLKKDLFENGDASSQEVANASKAINTSLDQFDFQPKIEALVTDFYQGLTQKGGFSLNINLVDFKNIFISNISSATDKQSVDAFSASIPDNWKVDFANYSVPLAAVALIYSNYELILIIYAALVLLFFVFCLLVNFKYLRLFFWVFMIVGIFTLIQLALWKIVNIAPFLANIESQGRSGVGILVENFADYFKQENIALLFWESIYIIGPSLLGLIVISLIPTKIGSVPLHETK